MILASNVKPLPLPPFEMGMDTDTPTEEGVFWRRMGNLFPGPEGGLSDPGGFEEIVVAGTTGAEVVALRYYEYNGDALLIYVRGDDNTIPIRTYDEATATASFIAIDSTVGTISVAAHPRIEQVDQRLFFTGIADDGKLCVWDGPGTPLRAAGLAAPVDPIIVNSAGVGLLNSTGFPDYQVVYSLVNRYGEESNPSPLSLPFAANDEEFEYTLGVANYDGLVDDGFIIGVRVYRVGGRLGELRLAFEFVPETTITPGEWADAATSALPIDNVPDSAVGFDTPTYTAEVPPADAVDLVNHLSKLWLAVPEGNRLYFSRLNSPEAFGYNDDGVPNDGGYVVPDADTTNPFVSLSSMGDLLVAGRAIRNYVVLGSDFSDITPNQRSNFGIYSVDGLRRCDTSCYFMATSGKPFLLGDDKSEQVWQRIWKYLRPHKDYSSDTGTAYFDGRFYVSTRTGDVITWEEVTDATTYKVYKDGVEVQDSPQLFYEDKSQTLLPVGDFEVVAYDGEDILPDVIPLTLGPISVCLAYDVNYGWWAQLYAPPGKPYLYHWRPTCAITRRKDGRDQFVIAPWDGGIWRVLNQEVPVSTAHELESSETPFGVSRPTGKVSGVSVDGSLTETSTAFTLSTSAAIQVYSAQNPGGPMILYFNDLPADLCGSWYKFALATTGTVADIDGVSLIGSLIEGRRGSG